MAPADVLVFVNALRSQPVGAKELDRDSGAGDVVELLVAGVAVKEAASEPAAADIVVTSKSHVLGAAEDPLL